MHSLVRTCALVVGTIGIGAVVACSGSDGAPESGDGTQAVPSSTTAANTPPPASNTTTTPPSTTQQQQQTGDGGVHDGGGTPQPTGTSGALGSSCQQNSDCKSNVCFMGGQASYCSLKCTQQNAATVCVGPTFNGVCNSKGYCRLP